MPILTVPEPCHESWLAMTPATQGRHCAACNKVVVDFTRMSDAELLAFLNRKPNTSCGRFTSKQLNRPLVVPAAPTPWRRWLAAAAFTLGLGEVVASSARAQVPVSHLRQQAEPDIVDPSSVKFYTKGAVKASAASQVLVRGRVLVSNTREALPGAMVLIVGLNMSTSTRADGSFELLIPTNSLKTKRKITLSYSSVGFVSREQRVRITDSSIEVAPVKLKPASMILGGIAFLPAPTSVFGQ